MGQVLDCSKCCTNADEENQEINDDNGAKRIAQQPAYADTTKTTRNSENAKTAAQKVSFIFSSIYLRDFIFSRRRRFC